MSLAAPAAEIQDLDIPEEDAVAVVLEEDVAGRGLAESGDILELALGLVGQELAAAALELEDPDIVEPVLDAPAPDDDPRAVPDTGRDRRFV